MDPHRLYDYLTRSRGWILDRVRALPPGAYTQTFQIGPGTIARTLTHMMISEWYYVQRMLEADVPSYEHWAIKDETPPTFPELEEHWARQAEATRAALTSIRDWNAKIEYRVTRDDGQRQIATCSPNDLFTQLAFHEVHHRAQVMNMLRQLGVKIDDIDFNQIMYARRPADG